MWRKGSRGRLQVLLTFARDFGGHMAPMVPENQDTPVGPDRVNLEKSSVIVVLSSLEWKILYNLG